MLIFMNEKRNHLTLWSILKSIGKQIKDNLFQLIRIYPQFQGRHFTFEYKINMMLFGNDSKLSMIWRTKGTISICSIRNFILFFCILRKSRIWFTKRSIRSVLRSTTCNCSRTSSGKVLFFKTYSTGPAINVSGVRSS